MAIEDWTFTPITGFEPTFDRMRREMDDMFHRFGMTAGVRGSFPASNVYDTGDEILMAVDAPGVKKDQLKIELREWVLTFSGSRDEAEPAGGTLLRDERPVGEFLRAFTIPAQVQSDKIQAQFKDGILTSACLKPRRLFAKPPRSSRYPPSLLWAFPPRDRNELRDLSGFPPNRYFLEKSVPGIPEKIP